MGNRSRFFIRDSVNVGDGDSISVLQTPPWNSTLIQFGIKYSTAVTAPGNFLITKFGGPIYSFQIYLDDPSLDGKESVLALCDVEFRKGDAIICIYPNPDDITVAIELIFREAQ